MNRASPAHSLAKFSVFTAHLISKSVVWQAIACLVVSQIFQEWRVISLNNQLGLMIVCIVPSQGYVGSGGVWRKESLTPMIVVVWYIDVLAHMLEIAALYH